MAKVKLYLRKREAETLPGACIRCGAPAETTLRKSFAWSPPWIGVLILVGLVPYLVVALLLTKRAKAVVPLCAAHRNHWRWRALVTWLGLVALLGPGVAAVTVSASADQRDRRRSDELLGYVCFGGFALGMGWLITALVLQTTGIRPTNIDDESMTLANVAPGYGELLAQHRESRYLARQEAVAAAVAAGGTDTKPCPFCGELIKRQAIRCRYCQEDLPDDGDFAAY